MSQTCNLYNPSFDKVPVFEIVGASKIDACHGSKMKGDDPRVLHVEATDPEGHTVALEIDIQKRRWLPRTCLAEVLAPILFVANSSATDSPLRGQWLDNLAGWMARSYTRVALPDEFNIALGKSKVRQIIEEKLAKEKDSLFGIYLSLEPDDETSFGGPLGLMPPPYALGITLVVHEDRSPQDLRKKLVKQLFDDQIEDPADRSQKTTRAALALKEGIRIVPQGVEARTVADINVAEIGSLIRYSMVDYLSDSSFSSGL